MNYYEMVVAVSLEDDLHFLDSHEFISNLISRAMFADEELKQIHSSRTFKFYNFCLFQPTEIDKVYRKGRIYVTRIRSLSSGFLHTLKKSLSLVEYPVEIIAKEIYKCEYHPISTITTITPAIATVFDKSWTKEDGLLLIRDRAHVNALKKYRAYFGDMPEPEENFIEYIQQINIKPIKIPYKNTSLLGNKFVIGVKGDEISQKLAFTVLGAGLLEKSSLGMGYCSAR